MRDLTPDEMEELWDAFEAVDHAAAQFAFGSATNKSARDALAKAVRAYRVVRDRIDDARNNVVTSAGSS